MEKVILWGRHSNYANGQWIKLERDTSGGEDHVREQIARMLKASPIDDAEEYAIHDYEGFEGAELSEYSGIAEVCALAEFIAEHGTLGGKLLEYYDNLDDAREALDDHYAGCFDSVADFAQNITEETTKIPETLRYYIDYYAMARDLEINDILAIETGMNEVHIFWQH